MSLTLQEVEKAFFDWRQMRPHASAKIPTELWDQVSLLLASGCSKAMICSRLRVNHTQLKMHCSFNTSKMKVTDVLVKPSFVTVPATKPLENQNDFKLDLVCGDKTLTLQSNMSCLDQAVAAFKELL